MGSQTPHDEPWTYLEVGLPLVQDLLDLEGQALAWPHGAQLSEPPIADGINALEHP